MPNQIVPLRPAEGVLEFYDSACRALDQAHKIDEVKDIHDRAVAVRAYARQIKNRKATADLMEIVKRAEMKMGRMIIEMEERSERQSVGGNRRSSPLGSGDLMVNPLPTLANLGLDSYAAKNARRLGKLSDTEFNSRFRLVRNEIEVGRSVNVNNVLDPSEPGEERPPEISIDEAVSQSRRWWDKQREEGEQLQKLKEIARFRRHAITNNVEGLVIALKKFRDDLDQLIRRLDR
jgi:hypothetical protein